MAPALSWMTFGCMPDVAPHHCSQNQCASNYTRLHAQLGYIREWSAAHPGRIEALQFWSGQDDDKHNCGTNSHGR
jgi:hypothetical protein